MARHGRIRHAQTRQAAPHSDTRRGPPGPRRTVVVPPTHFVNGNPMRRPCPPGMAQALFGMGCFWGPSASSGPCPASSSPAVGYAGGHTPNPTYEEVCSGMTGHTEVVRVVFDPAVITFEQISSLLGKPRPHPGYAAGNDVGTQYRLGGLLYDDAQRQAIESSRAAYESALMVAGHGVITSDLARPGVLLRRGLSSAVSRQNPAATAVSVARASPARPD